MKVLVLGATGGTGRLIVRDALRVSGRITPNVRGSHAWRCLVFVGDYPRNSVAHVDVRLTMVRRPQDSPVTVSNLQPMR